MIINVTAALIIKDRRVLLARRAKFSHLAGLWEFPGGKVEIGETPQGCLQRELAEELQIRIDERNIARFDESFYEYGQKRVLLLGMIVGSFEGTVSPLEHEEIIWARRADVVSIPLAPADVPLARRLIRYGKI
jgi:8-oxo-dGTP diphosphatase